jgi:alkanesulfonate monooxygenase SsuD/methylene tetrahydromethanopterin reductase-like flavin-dependent oxidoreductase (luciferase family)
MEFGIFDHLDRSDLPLAEFYEGRLKLAEAYDRGGFFCYHIAEHHSTPLGLAPSPGVFLSAVAQRTKRLRLGPLVYTLPLYNPLRLIEEICMLDHMSGGRLEIGVGRGISPIEVGLYGLNVEHTPRQFAEALEVILKGLANPTLDHAGEFYRYRNVPLELAPVQRPHPPLWFGGHSLDSAARAARQGGNYVTQDTAKATRPFMDEYCRVWAETRGAAPRPKLGLARFIVVAETDDEALRLARRAYARWYANFTSLYRRFNQAPLHERLPNFDDIRHGGRGVAGSPATVTEMLQAQAAEAGIDYVVGQFAFGDMSLAESQHSIELFATKVMPALSRP